MSATYTNLIHTQYPDAVDVAQKTANFDFTEKVDYQDYVHALEFNSVKDAVLAIETVMGPMPQSTFGTVDARLHYLEQFNTDFYDARYGGAGWKDIKDDQGNLIAPTILSHVHSGGTNAPPKVDLQAHVTGQLKRDNILLTGTGALTSNYIYVDETNTTTVKAALDSKFNTSGGNITGDISVTGNATFNGITSFRSFFEGWCGQGGNMTAGAGGTLVSRTDAWNSSAYKNTTINSSSGYISLCSASTNHLRYNSYAVIFRIYAEDTVADNIIRFASTNSGQSTVYYNVPGSFITPNKWVSLSMAFDHTQCANNLTTFALEYNQSISTYIYCDGITVVPIHVAFWG